MISLLILRFIGMCVFHGFTISHVNIMYCLVVYLLLKYMGPITNQTVLFLFSMWLRESELKRGIILEIRDHKESSSILRGLLWALVTAYLLPQGERKINTNYLISQVRDRIHELKGFRQLIVESLVLAFGGAVM